MLGALRASPGSEVRSRKSREQVTGNRKSKSEVRGAKCRGQVTAKGHEPAHGTTCEAKSLPQGNAHVEDGGFQLSLSFARDEPAHEDETPGASDGSSRKYRGLPRCTRNKRG